MVLESISVSTQVVSVSCESGSANIIKQGINGLFVREGEVLALALRIVLRQACYTDAPNVKASALAYIQAVILQQYEQVLTGWGKNKL